MDPTPAPLVPQDGWHCLHLFYRIEYGQWQLLDPAEQRAAKVALSTLVQETRAHENTQLLTLSQVTPKADLGFMLITPDLQSANRIEKQLTLSGSAGYMRSCRYFFIRSRKDSIAASNSGVAGASFCSDASVSAHCSSLVLYSLSSVRER
jgi:chlorite dismutase